MTLRLNSDEAAILAARLIARAIDHGHADEWLPEEDLPNLDTDSYTMLLDGCHDLATEIWALVHSGEALHDIDSAYLLEQAKVTAR